MSRFQGELYPPLEPHTKGWLDVGDGHQIYWEVSGNPNGQPAVFLHGGPGGACHSDHRRLFNPNIYKIILFDQRGCGRSIPHAMIEANSTAHLVADLEHLRSHLAIERWLILGGSWGATLALAYAQAFPARVEALVLRGVFTGRQSELDWLYRFGASQIYPDAWQRFLDPIPAAEREDLISAGDRIPGAARASFFIGRNNFAMSGDSAMPLWQDVLFIALYRNAANPTDWFNIPANRVIELGAQYAI